jgi:hypothetical protein
MSVDCDVSDYFPERYDKNVPYNMAKHRILGKNNKKIDEYTERGCAESELVEDIHENFCTIGQIKDLVERREAPRSKLKTKLRFYKSFKDKDFAERHNNFSKKLPCEALAIKVSMAIKLTEQSVWLKLQRDPYLAAMIWPDFKDKLLPNKRSAMTNYVETIAEANATRQMELDRGYGRWRNDKIYRPGINCVDLDLVI